MRHFVRSMFLIAILVFACTPGYSQGEGVIVGRVTDTTGAVVVGAAITVTQTDMHFETATTTNAEGLYRVGALLPGPYQVSVTAPGFQHLVRGGLVLRTDETLNVDGALQVGSQTDTIQVSSAATLLQTETSSTGVVLNGDYVNELPIYQRRELSVLYFTPGVTMAYTNNGVIASLNAFHINGQRSQDVGYFEDGVVTTQSTIMGSVDEIKVVSTVPPAEYGHAAGGFVTVVKKYGSNEFHGTLSEIGRTRIMTERKFFDEYRNSQIYPGHPTPDGYFQQYPEGNVSGPVYIPKVYDGRNKSFFMFTLQRQMESQFHQTPFTAPDANMLAGNFSFGGIGQPIYNPHSYAQSSNGTWSASPFPGNIIPMNLWDPVAVKLLSFTPFRVANDALGVVGTTGPTNNVFYSQDARQNIPQYAARFDQQFTSNVKMFASWSDYKTDCEPTKSGTVQYKPFDSGQDCTTSWQDTTAAGMTWLFSPTFLSDTHLGYYRNNSVTASPSYNQSVAAELGIPGLPPTTFPLGLYTGIGQPGPSRTVNENITVREDLSKAKGKHAIKFGYELLRFRMDATTVGTPDGTFTMGGTNGLQPNGVATPNTGNPFASFLLGAVTSATFTKSIQANLPRSWQNSAYIQDDWRVSPTITVNIGLRYSLENPPTQKNGLSSVFNPTAVDPNSNNYLGFTCPPGGCLGAYVHNKGASLYNPDTKRFDPRFGLAWHAMPRLVVRSGFGITTVDNRLTYIDSDELVTNSVTQSQPTGNPQVLYYLSQGVNPINYPALRADGSIPYAGVPGGHTATWVDPNLKNPYTMNWNFNLQYELSKNYVLSTGYSGSGSVDLTGTMQVNTIPYGYDLNNLAALTAWIPTAQYSRPFPNWGNIGYVGNFGHATHHEGTVGLEKRLSGGLNFTTFYTYSKSIAGTAVNEFICTCLEKAPAPFNNKHTFSATSTYELPVGKGRAFLNHGGWKDVLLGGYDLTIAFSARSGGPLNLGLTGAPTLTYPSFVANYGNVLLYKDPELRNDWQNLGGDRFNTGNQNNLWNCTPNAIGAALTSSPGTQCFSYIPSYGMGNDGSYITNSQRIIAFAFSATKVVTIHERLRFQVRYDFQNPFKWYTWNAANNVLALGSPTLYGKITGNLDAGTANLGGQPLMNLGFALMW